VNIVLNKAGRLSVRSLVPPQLDHDPVLMVHGGGQDWWVFEAWMRRLAAHGFAAHALSLRGRGDSWPLPEEAFCALSSYDYRDDVLHACHALDLRAPVLLGHSLGGIAVQLAAQELACSALVLVASAGPAALGVRRGLLPADRLVVRTPEEARRRYFHSANAQVIEQTIRRLVPESPGALNTSGGRVPIDPTKIRCPVLAMSGACDATDVPGAAQLAKLYRGTSIVLADTGHNIMQEATGELACAWILAWLPRLQRI